MTHPSIEGLREAVEEALMAHYLDGRNYDENAGCAPHVSEAITEAQAAYLAEHGVGWFGEELVRAEELTREHTRFVTPPFFHLVPVPQDGE